MIYLRKEKPSIINGLKKTFKDMVHMIPEQMIQDPVGNIHKNSNARKQTEGNHFVIPRGGRQRSKVWLRIDFFTYSTQFGLIESKSVFKTIFSYQEVVFFSLATSITIP